MPDCCQLRHYFDGIKPRQGVHSYRILDVAVFDFGLVLLLALLFARWRRVSFWKVFGAALLIGIVTHRFFNIRTKFDTILFPTPF